MGTGEPIPGMAPQAAIKPKPYPMESIHTAASIETTKTSRAILEARPSAGTTRENIEVESQKVKGNCIGFALFKLGLTETEKEIEEPEYLQLTRYLRRTDRKNAQVIGMVSASGRQKDGRIIYKGRVVHMALIDSQNPNLVTHRPGSGDDAIHEEKSVALAPWKGSRDYQIIYFKERKKHKVLKLEPLVIPQVAQNIYKLN